MKSVALHLCVRPTVPRSTVTDSPGYRTAVSAYTSGVSGGPSGGPYLSCGVAGLPVGRVLSHHPHVRTTPHLPPLPQRKRIKRGRGGRWGVIQGVVGKDPFQKTKTREKTLNKKEKERYRVFREREERGEIEVEREVENREEEKKKKTKTNNHYTRSQQHQETTTARQRWLAQHGADAWGEYSAEEPRRDVLENVRSSWRRWSRRTTTTRPRHTDNGRSSHHVT